MDKAAIMQKVLAVLATFDTDPALILALLRTTRGIVSGSAALLMVADVDFNPGDIDIYVPTSQIDTALALAEKRLGFKPVPFRVQGYAASQTVNRVFYLIKGSKHMNIMVVRGEDPTVAIFQFHSTAVMNYLTAYGLYCAYPSLTKSKLSVANVSTLIGESGRRDRIEACFDKYRRRGILVENDVTKFPGHEIHNCFVDAECPHTVRSTIDGKGDYVELFERTEAEAEWEKLNGRMAIWHMGGPMCDAKNIYFSNFATSLKSAPITAQVLDDSEI
ncbi:hypothetical protein DFH09DRAFT_1334137 [Mycena vulgaris]|nr:hypothetical protein DFH09DRAFT_1334137 [Mycena vulgaris]